MRVPETPAAAPRTASLTSAGARHVFRLLVAAGLLGILAAGCGSCPPVSASKAAEVSDTFRAYAGAVQRIEARWEGGLDESESTTARGELGLLRESLEADAVNLKIDATTDRIESLGAALGSVPHPAAKAAGAVLGLLAAGIAFFGRRKKPVSGAS